MWVVVCCRIRALSPRDLPLRGGGLPVDLRLLSPITLRVPLLGLLETSHSLALTLGSAPLAFVGYTLALVGHTLAIVGKALALVGHALALVGHTLAPIGGGLLLFQASSALMRRFGDLFAPRAGATAGLA
jgi:hypothetical protein